MSQAIRGGIIALAACIVIFAGLAFLFLTQKNTAEKQLSAVQEKLDEANRKQEKVTADFSKLQQQADDLKKRLTDSSKKNDELQNSYDEYKRKAEDLNSQIDQANQEKDSWKNRYEKSRKELEEAVTKLQNRPKEIVYKDRPVEETPAAPATPAMVAPAGTPDEYWAGILKQKAELQVQLDKAKTELNNDALLVADLRKQNTELQLQIKDLNADKEEIDRRLSNEKKSLIDSFTKEKQDLMRKLKDSEDLASNLSMESARARGDQKNTNDYLGKVKQDNVQLQSQVRQLVSTKVALEKTVARLTEQKADLGKKLSETEGVIQDRINEIWQIKQTLDQKITQINDSKNKYKEVDLPPIVVNASGNANSMPSDVAVATGAEQVHKVISLNEKNNFVIVDYGETQGSTIGRILKAYRNNKEIATLEVIQVRRDISAADIKEQKTKIQVGDQVR